MFWVILVSVLMWQKTIVAKMYQGELAMLPAVFVSANSVVHVYSRVFSTVRTVMILFLVLIARIRLVCRILIWFHYRNLLVVVGKINISFVELLCRIS